MQRLLITLTFIIYLNPINSSYATEDKKNHIQINWLRFCEYKEKKLPPPFVANWINFIILSTLIALGLRKPLKKYLKSKKDLIKKELDKSEAERQEALKRYKEYTNRLQNLEKEITRLKQGLIKNIELERKELLNKAKKRAEEIEKEARLFLQEEARQAREKIKTQAIKETIKEAENILIQRLQKHRELDLKLGQKYLEELEKIK
jgi:F0F1-type ATP synthase membrane subunit b/b'